MGCFSFICRECGKGINSTSFHGENVRLSLLKDGKVIEEMQGEYDSYGRVFDKDMKSFEWSLEWDKVCDLIFSPNISNGIRAIHVSCLTNHPILACSPDDPDQGWNKIKPIHRGKCEIYHKIY